MIGIESMPQTQGIGEYSSSDQSPIAGKQSKSTSAAYNEASKRESNTHDNAVRVSVGVAYDSDRMAGDGLLGQCQRPPISQR